MAKIEEIREWLRSGQKTEDLPSHWKKKEAERRKMEKELSNMPKPPKLDVGKARRRHHSGMFTVSMEGDDAILNFGKFRGQKVSELAVDPRGRSYLNWILGQDFPEALKEIIRVRVS